MRGAGECIGKQITNYIQYNILNGQIETITPRTQAATELHHLAAPLANTLHTNISNQETTFSRNLLTSSF